VRRPQCPSQAGRYLPQADYLRLSGHRNRAGARGQVSPAGQAQLRGWLAWFAGREEVTFAGSGHHMAVHRRGAGLGRHHGASRRAGEGRKRHAKTGGTNSRTPPSGMSACQLRLGGLLRRHPQRSDLARPAGFEPATRCLEGTVPTSLDVARRRSTSHLPAVTVAGCRRASRDVCFRWLPCWLPENLLASANVRMNENSIDGIAFRCAAYPFVPLVPVRSGCFGAGCGVSCPSVLVLGVSAVLRGSGKPRPV